MLNQRSKRTNIPSSFFSDGTGDGAVPGAAGFVLGEGAAVVLDGAVDGAVLGVAGLVVAVVGVTGFCSGVPASPGTAIDRFSLNRRSPKLADTDTVTGETVVIAYL